MIFGGNLGSGGNFGPGAFNLGAFSGGLAPGGNSGSIPAFQIGVDAGGGFAKPSSGIAGKFGNLLGGLFGGGQGDSSFGQALALGGLSGNLATQAANIQGQAADVAAQNARNNMLTDFNLGRLAYGDKQKLNTNRLARQKNLMGVVPSLMNSTTYSTGNPNAGAFAGAQLAGMIG